MIKVQQDIVIGVFGSEQKHDTTDTQSNWKKCLMK